MSTAASSDSDVASPCVRCVSVSQEEEEEEEDYGVFPIDKWKLNDPTRNDRYWRLEVVKHVRTTECDLCSARYAYKVEIVNWEYNNFKHRVCHACLRRLINTQVNEFNEWSGE